MQGDSGRGLQAAMRQPAAAETTEWAWGHLVRGVVRGIRYKDTSDRKVTVVDVYIMDHKTERGILYNVPVMYHKMSREHGEEWCPAMHDYVVVGFFNKNLRDPVVLGYLAPPDNEIQAAASQHGRSYRKRSGTSEEIDRSGNRKVYVAADDTLEVAGDGTITVHGNVTIIVHGQADITVDGPTTVTTPTATVHAETLVELDTPLVHATGNLAVDGGISCAGTYGASGGKIETPGDIESTGGDVKDSTRSMAADRGIFNGHTHPGDSGGTTGTPNQQQ